MNTSASILRRLRPHLLSQGTTHHFLSYYVPVAVRRRQKLEALKSLREALHAETVMRSSEQDSSAMGNNNTTTVETPSVSTLSDPTLETVKQLPTSFRHLDNSTLMILASIDHPPLFKARSEYLKRHVMSVDNIDYNQACKRVEEIEETSRQNMTFTALPYQLGIGAALATSIISTPLIFHYDSVAWFNENYVTSDNPEPKDLETMLEVGGWSWSWYVIRHEDYYISTLC